MVSAAVPRTGFDCQSTLSGGAAARPLRRADQGQRRPQRVCRVGSARCTRCWPRWRTPVAASAAISSNPSAGRSLRSRPPSTGCGHIRTASTPTARHTRPWRWPRPTRRIRTAQRCRGPRWRLTTRTHRPGRKAGALVVLVDGELVWFLERGGRSLLNFSSDPEARRAAAGAWPNWSATGGFERSSSNESTACRCSSRRNPVTGRKSRPR